MKKISKLLLFLLFLSQLLVAQDTGVRYFFYDDAGNRILRKDRLNETPVGCPSSLPGYTKLGEYGGHGYFMSTNPAKWVDAKVSAENDGGYLAAISDQAENDWLKNQLGNEMVFIGYNDETTEGSMEWANGEAVTFDLGYSNSATNDYGLMNFWAGTWQLVGPWQSRKYILEMDCGNGGGPTGNLTISCPANINVTTQTTTAVVTWTDATASTTCSVNTNVNVNQTAGAASGSSFPIGTTTISYEATDNCNNTETCSFVITVTAAQGGGCVPIAGFTKLGEQGGHGYYLSNDSKSWAQAKTLAENAGGYLATMNNQAENDWLKSHLNNNMVFIGYNDAATEGTGQWANNEPVTLDLSYSNSADNDYAVMNFWAGTWQMVNHWVSKKYVMEKGCMVPPPPIPPSPARVTGVQVYPNPTDGYLTIDGNKMFTDEAMVYIVNSGGLMVEKRTLDDGEFDISHLPTGTYMIILKEGVQTYQFRIVKGD